MNSGSRWPSCLTHGKDLSSKGVDEANPQREGEGRDEGQREQAMMTSFEPTEPTAPKLGKLLDLTVTWANISPLLLERV